MNWLKFRLWRVLVVERDGTALSSQTIIPIDSLEASLAFKPAKERLK